MWRKFLCSVGLHKREDDHDDGRFPAHLTKTWERGLYVIGHGIPWKCTRCSKKGWE